MWLSGVEFCCLRLSLLDCVILKFSLAVIVSGSPGESSWHQHSQWQRFDFRPQHWAHRLSCRVSPASSNANIDTRPRPPHQWHFAAKLGLFIEEEMKLINYQEKTPLQKTAFMLFCLFTFGTTIWEEFILGCYCFNAMRRLLVWIGTVINWKLKYRD